jgi:hypothetical protein
MKRATRLSLLIGLAATLPGLALSGCHNPTDSLVVVTAKPADGSVSDLDALIVRVGSISQTFELPSPLTTAGATVGLYLPDGVTGHQTVSATATHAAGPCAAGYAGHVQIDIAAAGGTSTVMITMTPETTCPPGAGGAGGSGGAGGTGGGAGAGVAGTGGHRPHAEPQFTACTEIDHGDPGSCTHCTANSTADVRVYGVAISPTDPSLVVTGGTDGRIKVWTNTNGTLTAQGTVLSGSGLGVVAFSPDGTLLAVGRTGGVDIVNVSDWSVARTLITLANVRTYGVAFSPDGANVFAIGVPSSSMTGGGLFVFEVGNPQLLILQAAPKVFALAVSPAVVSDVVPVAVTDGSGKATIYSWSPLTRKLADPVSLFVTAGGTTAEAAAFSLQGSMFAAGGDDDIVNLWSYPTDAYALPNGAINLGLATPGNRVSAIAFTPHYGWVIVGASALGSLSAYELAYGDAIGQRFDTHFDVISVAVSPDSSLVVAGEYDCGCLVVCPQ